MEKSKIIVQLKGGGGGEGEEEETAGVVAVADYLTR